MNDEMITNFVIEIKSKLSSIDTKVDGVVQRLDDHAARIKRLEDKSTPTLKDNLIEFGLKAIIGLIAVIISLTGAGGIFSKFFGQ